MSKNTQVFIFELTQKCNNNCLYCYNVWKSDSTYPQGELSALELKTLFRKLKEEMGKESIVFSGGEPLLRKDFLEILNSVKEAGMRTVLITNGTLLTKEMVRECVKGGVSLFEVTLLSHLAEIHNELVQNNDAWLKVIEAIINIKAEKARLVTPFVATKKNIADLPETIKLAIALSADGMMFNRFNVGGTGIKHMEELMPSLEELKKALATANEMSDEYNFPMSVSTAIPPCVIDLEQYKALGTGMCGAGTELAYYTIDSCGLVRPCNHSRTIIGDFKTQSMTEIINSTANIRFCEALPPSCLSCPINKKCQGCCKAAAEQCYGSIYTEEPFLKLYYDDCLKKSIS